MDGVVFKGDDALSMDKAVIFIVEGATDKRALENIFKKIYRYKDLPILKKISATLLKNLNVLTSTLSTEFLILE